MLLTCCTSSRGPNADYYYPINELEDELLYTYESVGDAGFGPHYWAYSAKEFSDSTILSGTYYDANRQPRQHITERIVNDGSLRRSLTLLEPGDSATNERSATVLEPVVFSFEPPNPDRLLVSAVRWQEEGITYTVTHNRHYLRDTSIVFNGQSYPAQTWMVRELIEQDSAGVLALESRAIEVYAKGIGLAYRERLYSDGTVEAHRLVRRE